MEKANGKKMHLLFKRYKKQMTSENLEKIYIEYRKLAYGIAFSFVKNRENAEDILQNVFYKLFNIKNENLPDQNESSWFYTVIKNESINFIKKKKETINIDEIYSVKDTNNEIANITNIIYFNQIIKKLSIKEKEIVSLKILSDLSFKEISVLLNIPMATVEWKYYKAIKEIKIIIVNLIMFIVSFTYGLFNIKTKEVPNDIYISKENVVENTSIDNNNIEHELADKIPEENTNTNMVEEIGTESNNTYETTYITGAGILSFVISVFCIISIVINLIKRKKHK